MNNHVKRSSPSSKPWSASTLLHSYFLIGGVLLVGVVLGIGLYSISPYFSSSFGLQSRVAASLRVFYYNQSKHTTDPVAGCWYDSGDYIVFLQRNIQSTYYLSVAYKYAHTAPVKQELKTVIDQQLGCIDQMIAHKEKQFRDQRSHREITPPLMDELLSPQTTYILKPSEGLDVLLLRALIATNLSQDATPWLQQAKSLTQVTRSEQCCEEGPLQISATNLTGLQELTHPEAAPATQSASWSLDLINMYLLENHHEDRVAAQLRELKQAWTNDAHQFHYLGGNYDIAGFIAAERLYALHTGDDSLRSVSDTLYTYLHGQNSYGVNFTQYQHPYHPCGTWWGQCHLTETLLNGVDESGQFNTHRPDIWRLTEIQLVGQSQYVLAYVLYNNL